MTVKIKFQICLIFLSFTLIVLKFFFNDLSIGKIWFFLDGNSLVGIQSYAEEISKSYKIGIYFYDIIIFLLSLNSLLILGIIFILISFFIFYFELLSS